MVLKKRLIFAALLAPLVGVLAVSLIAAAESVFYSVLQRGPGYGDPSTEVLVIFAIVIGLPLAYLVGWSIGVPVILILHRNTLTGVRVFVFSGVAAGILVGGINGIVMRQDVIFIGLSILLAVTFFVVGFVSFWFIAKKEMQES